MDLLEAQVDDIHWLFRANRLTPSQLLEFYLDRIGALDLRTDHGPPFNCIVCISPSVRQEARTLTEEISRHGVSRALHGIPVWVKDNIPVAGLPTTCGSLALAEGVAPRDAPMIQRLRSAGALIMGKVGMTELSIGISEYSGVSGRIGNALEPRNAPGGSSSGSAVAVSLNFGMLALGVDDCSSITGPAAANSCVGLRPTVGMVSRAGLFSYSHTETAPGPIGRTVSDAARMLEALAERDLPSHGAEHASLRGRRIGVLAAVEPVDFMAEVPARVKEEFAACLRRIEDAGGILIEGLQREGFGWSRYAAFEHYNVQVQSLRQRKAAPRTPRQLYSSDKVSPLIRRFGRTPLFRLGLPFRLPNVHARSYRRVIRHNQRWLDELLAGAGVDLLIAVTTSAPSRIATLAQLPHLTVPAGAVAADKELAARGFVPGSPVPWSISILGRPGWDRDVLAAGAALELILDGRISPDPPVRPTPSRIGLDIDGFNRLKQRIAQASARRLELDDAGRTYIHPTADEFRTLVREICTVEGGVLTTEVALK